MVENSPEKVLVLLRQTSFGEHYFIEFILLAPAGLACVRGSAGAVGKRERKPE